MTPILLMFPKVYAVFLIVQLAILFVVYVVLRLITGQKVLTTLCFSVLVVAALTLLLLCFKLHSVAYVSYVDQLEYVSGTLIVAIPFVLILIVKFLKPFMRKIASRQKATGPERARILRMIEEGKITAEEGGDLLEAMGKSNALLGQDRFSRLDVAILCGVALVVMGFFLPWIYVRDPISRMQFISDMFRQITVYKAGYHTGAIGWTIFVIALVTIVPVFVTPKNLLYKISILHLFLTLVGLLLVLITLLRVGSHLGIGIIVCAVGFTIELIASGAKFKHLAA